MLCFDKTITIVNRLHFQDTENGKDCYKKTIIKNCYFSETTQKNTNNNISNFKKTYVCKILENKEFVEYDYWLIEQKGFTITVGDFVFLGEIKEEVSSKNILEIVEKNKNSCFKVNLIKNNMHCPLLKHLKVEGDGIA